MSGQPPPYGHGQPQSYGQPGYGQGPPPPVQYGYGAPPPGQPGYAPHQQPPYGAPGGVQLQPLRPGGQPQVQWMSRPTGPPGCPPGLEYLSQIDQLLVKQQVELLEVLTGWETANKYKISNSMGQQVYFAAEESDACSRQCCGANRGFTIHITDNAGQEVIRVTREFKCCAMGQWFACIDACAHEVQVEAPPGHVVGYIKQQRSCCEPRYEILDANHDKVLAMQGPCCMITGPCCTWDHDFVVYSRDMANEVGKISKQWSGLLKEYFTDADNFGVSFPMDLDVKMKAVMMGAVFLIDFMFFEHQQNQQNQNRFM